MCSQPGKNLFLYLKLKSDVLSETNSLYMFLQVWTRGFFSRAFYLFRVEQEDEFSINKEKVLFILCPSQHSLHTVEKFEVLCSRSCNSVSANTVLIKCMLWQLHRWSVSNKKVTPILYASLLLLKEKGIRPSLFPKEINPQDFQ